MSFVSPYLPIFAACIGWVVLIWVSAGRPSLRRQLFDICLAVKAWQCEHWGHMYMSDPGALYYRENGTKYRTASRMCRRCEHYEAWEEAVPTMPSFEELSQLSEDWLVLMNQPIRGTKPMTSTTSRTRFEEILTACHLEQGLPTPNLATMDGEEYVSREVQSAWWGWEAATSALVVQLPPRVEAMTAGDVLGTERANGHNLMRKRCVDALRAIGVRVEGEV